MTFRYKVPRKIVHYLVAEYLSNYPACRSLVVTVLRTNFRAECTKKKMDYDRTNTILVSVWCNHIPGESQPSRDFCWRFNEIQLVTSFLKLDLKVPNQKLLIQVLMFSLLAKFNSNFCKLVFKCVELEAQQTKASSSAQNYGRKVCPKDLNFSRQ